jgi:hypothetical protein
MSQALYAHMNNKRKMKKKKKEGPRGPLGLGLLSLHTLDPWSTSPTPCMGHPLLGLGARKEPCRRKARLGPKLEDLFTKSSQKPGM